jgi:hypothetical protein
MGCAAAMGCATPTLTACEKAYKRASGDFEINGKVV